MIKNTAIKLVGIFLISISVLWLLKVAYTWKNPDVNRNGKRNIYNCIYDGNYETIAPTSMGQVLNVNYVRNADTACINPYFPAIHIATEAEHNAWLHVVYTDTTSPKWQQFIDTVDNSKSYPFYTTDQDFFDAPHWRYTLFSKPLKFWKGHAYAVKVNHKNGTIQCVGGVEWGFQLSYFSTRPKSITPSALTHQDWKKDRSIFKTTLKGYRVIEWPAPCDPEFERLSSVFKNIEIFLVDIYFTSFLTANFF